MDVLSLGPLLSFWTRCALGLFSCIHRLLFWRNQPVGPQPITTASSSSQLANETVDKTKDGISTHESDNKIASQRPHRPTDLTPDKTQDSVCVASLTLEPPDPHKWQNEVYRVPLATGSSDCCVEWVNRLLSLVYANPDTYIQPILASLLESLNAKLAEATQSLRNLSDSRIEFTNIDCPSKNRPKLSSVRTETETDRNVSIRFKLFSERVSFRLKLTKPIDTIAAPGQVEPASKAFELTNYELEFENFDANVKALALLADKRIQFELAGRPLVRMSLMKENNTKAIVTPSSACRTDEQSLLRLLLQLIMQAVAEWHYGDDPNIPECDLRRSRSPGLGDATKQLGHSLLQVISRSPSNSSTVTRAGNSEMPTRMLVKLLEVRNIREHLNCTCFLEIDRPDGQLRLTSTRRQPNLRWNDNDQDAIHIFTVDSSSRILHIELWDSVAESYLNKLRKPSIDQYLDHSALNRSARFLGMVSVKLGLGRRHDAQQHLLELKSMPKSASIECESRIQGQILLELWYLHEPRMSSPATTNMSRSLNTGSAASITISNTVDTSNRLDMQQTKSMGTQMSRSSFLCPIDSSRSTPIVRDTSDSEHYDLNYDRLCTSITSNGTSGNSLTAEPNANHSKLSRQVIDDLVHKKRSPQVVRSHSLKLSQTLSGLKRRLSFGRTSSHAPNSSSSRGKDLLHRPESGLTPGSSPGRSSSSALSGRSGDVSDQSTSNLAGAELNRLGSGRVPATRESMEVPNIVIHKPRHSRVASLTYPDSVLFIETRTKDGGPLYRRGSDIHRDQRLLSLRRRRGTKLHIIHRHQFAAYRADGSKNCHVCSLAFSKLPGKNAYQCRNCQLISHKRCHRLVEHDCPRPSLHEPNFDPMSSNASFSDLDRTSANPSASPSGPNSLLVDK